LELAPVLHTAPYEVLLRPSAALAEEERSRVVPYRAYQNVNIKNKNDNVKFKIMFCILIFAF